VLLKLPPKSAQQKQRPRAVHCRLADYKTAAGCQVAPPWRT
jgi:hypothetical protein